LVSWQLDWKETEERGQNEEIIVENKEIGSTICGGIRQIK
jgi:hypothetical protein